MRKFLRKLQFIRHSSCLDTLMLLTPFCLLCLTLHPHTNKLFTALMLCNCDVKSLRLQLAHLFISETQEAIFCNYTPTLLHLSNISGLETSFLFLSSWNGRQQEGLIYRFIQQVYLLIHRFGFSEVPQRKQGYF